MAHKKNGDFLNKNKTKISRIIFRICFVKYNRFLNVSAILMLSLFGNVLVSEVDINPPFIFQRINIFILFKVIFLFILSWTFFYITEDVSEIRDNTEKQIRERGQGVSLDDEIVSIIVAHHVSSFLFKFFIVFMSVLFLILIIILN